MRIEWLQAGDQLHHGNQIRIVKSFSAAILLAEDVCCIFLSPLWAIVVWVLSFNMRTLPYL